jgi:hypothetical protein
MVLQVQTNQIFVKRLEMDLKFSLSIYLYFNSKHHEASTIDSIVVYFIDSCAATNSGISSIEESTVSQRPLLRWQWVPDFIDYEAFDRWAGAIRLVLPECSGLFGKYWLSWYFTIFVFFAYQVLLASIGCWWNSSGMNTKPGSNFGYLYSASLYQRRPIVYPTLSK